MNSTQRRILVIDDDPDILDAIRFTLEDAGYLVETSEKGEHAERLTAQQNNLPDLIVLDVLLSGKDGRTICQKLKRADGTKKIPILMMSAHPAAERTVLEVGANAFLPKPFDVDQFLSTIETQLQAN